MATHADDDDLTHAAERDHQELRSLLQQSQYLLRRAQQVIERCRKRDDKR